MRFNSARTVRCILALPSAFALLAGAGMVLHGPAPMLAQSAPAASSATRLIGTVRSVSATQLTVAKDDGTAVMVSIPDGTRVQQLPAGSTDLKSAQDATAADISVGDRILIVAHTGDAGTLNASRVVLMKSSAIAQTNATRQADWQKRGVGGVVTAVDPVAHTVVISSGNRKTTVQTSSTTIFRRYAPGSVRFEDATLSKLSDVHAGDQLRVRGSRDVDSGNIVADEVVTGSFRNVSGLVSTVDAPAGTVTLKDLATNKNVTVALGPETDLRSLPPEMAARFAARVRTGGPSAAPAGQPPSPGRPAGDTGAPPGSHASGAPSDLSQVVGRLPKLSITELKAGEAIMVVGSGGTSANTITAITVLSGVEPLLAAAPSGSSTFNLSPWSIGGGEGAGAGTP